MKKIRLISIALILCLFASCAASCGKTLPAMEFRGKQISVNLYSYWQSAIKSNYVDATTDTEQYWSTRISEDETYADRMNDIVNMNVRYNVISAALFDEYGLTLDDETLTSIDSSIEDYIESFGSKNDANAELSKYNINIDMLKEIYTIEAKANAVYSHLYGDDGIRKITDEKLDEFFKNNYMHVNVMILFSSFEYEKDENGELKQNESGDGYLTRDLTEEESNAKQKTADEIISRLEAGESFEELKEQYNEDPKKELFSKGYYMSANEVSTYGADLILAVQELEIGEFTQTTDGKAIYIIQREELEDGIYKDETYIQQIPNISVYCSSEDFSVFMSDFEDEVKIFEENLSNYPIEKAALLSE